MAKKLYRAIMAGGKKMLSEIKALGQAVSSRRWNYIKSRFLILGSDSIYAEIGIISFYF